MDSKAIRVYRFDAPKKIEPSLLFRLLKMERTKLNIADESCNFELACSRLIGCLGRVLNGLL
jgi:hypothetical protein